MAFGSSCASVTADGWLALAAQIPTAKAVEASVAIPTLAKEK